MKLIELTPRPLEVALARVPAGMEVRAVREHADGPVSAVVTLAEDDEYLRWVQTPGGGFPWGAAWSTWYDPLGIGRGRHKRDRAVWQRAGRLVNAGGAAGYREPLAVYVVHEEQQDRGRTVWAAVRIRREGEE